MAVNQRRNYNAKLQILTNVMKNQTNAGAVALAASQQGYMGNPLVITNRLAPSVRVAHMSSSNVAYEYSAPRINSIPSTAPFIYNDIKKRTEQFIRRFLCNDDDRLQAESQMYRFFHHHLTNYLERTEDVIKEAKAALNPTRQRQSFTPLTPQLPFERVRDLVVLRRRIKAMSITADANTKAKLSRKIMEIEKKLRTVGNDTLKMALRTKSGEALRHSIAYTSTMRLISNPQCSSMYEHAFRSFPLPRTFKLLECQDYRIMIPDMHLYEAWRKEGSLGRVELRGIAHSPSVIPMRGIYGDRLVKRNLVQHTFISAVSAILYPNFTATSNGDHPVRERFEGISSEHKLMRNNTVKNKDTLKNPLENTSTELKEVVSMQWKENLRSFGETGPQSYWIQMMREMYDAVRVKNVREYTRRRRRTWSMNSKNTSNNNTPNKINTQQGKCKHALEQFSQKLPNLGVTEYGYRIADVENENIQWVPSYHRFGRSWYCMDVVSQKTQLPFGAYKDLSAPRSERTNTRSNNVAPFHNAITASGVQGLLKDIVLTHITTNVLQDDDSVGTQGRYGHIQTAYNQRPFGHLTPGDAFVIMGKLRRYTIFGRTEERPLVVKLDGLKVNISLGPELLWATLNARQSIAGTSFVEFDSPSNENISFTGLKNFYNNENRWNKATKDALSKTDLPRVTNQLQNIKNILNSDKTNVNGRGNNNVNKPNQYNNYAFHRHLITTFGNSNRASAPAAAPTAAPAPTAAAAAPPAAPPATPQNRKQQLMNWLNHGGTYDYSSWNEKHGAMKVTGHNLVYGVDLKQIGGGLTREDDGNNDWDILNKTVLFVDGDIFNNSQQTLESLLYSGSNQVLGIKDRVVEGDNVVLPLVLPVNPYAPDYDLVKRNAEGYFQLMYEDAGSGITGLVERLVEYVFAPMLKHGAITKAMHYNDLMGRFLEKVTNGSNSEKMNAFVQRPENRDVMKSLMFYLYTHAGYSTKFALQEIRKYEAQQDAIKMQNNFLLLAMSLRQLGNTGPIPPRLFRKIVRQHFLTIGSKNGKMSKTNVYAEVAKLQRELSKFRVLGREFTRKSFLPSFLGGVQRANKRMGVPTMQLGRNIRGNGTAFQSLVERAKDTVRNPSRIVRKLTGQPSERRANRNRNLALAGNRAARARIENQRMLQKLSSKNRTQELARRAGQTIGLRGTRAAAAAALVGGAAGVGPLAAASTAVLAGLGSKIAKNAKKKVTNSALAFGLRGFWQGAAQGARTALHRRAKT